jgi:hypothetical protein
VAVVLLREAEAEAAGRARFREHTLWPRSLAAPIRDFLTNEAGGAVILLGAALAALIWANSPWPHSYEAVWTTTLSIQLGDAGISQDLRHWVNEGFTTLYLLVLGLEARREVAMGQLSRLGSRSPRTLRCGCTSDRAPSASRRLRASVSSPASASRSRCSSRASRSPGGTSRRRNSASSPRRSSRPWAAGARSG